MLVPSQNLVKERALVDLDTRQSLNELKDKVAAEQEGQGAAASITEHPYPVESGTSNQGSEPATGTASAENGAWKDKWKKVPLYRCQRWSWRLAMVSPIRSWRRR